MQFHRQPPCPINIGSSEISSTKPQQQWIATTLMLMLLGVIAVPHDITVARFFEQGNLPGPFEDVLDRAETFAHGIGIAAILIILIVVDFSKRWAFPRVILATIAAGLAANGFKLLIGRLRPHSADLTAQVTDTFTGFLPLFSVGSSHRGCPSAHTTVVFAFAVGLCWLYPRGRYLFVSIALLAAMQRITSGAHFFSDVCWGASLGYFIGRGVISGWLTVQQFDRWEARRYYLNLSPQPTHMDNESPVLRKRNAA